MFFKKPDLVDPKLQSLRAEIEAVENDLDTLADLRAQLQAEFDETQTPDTQKALDENFAAYEKRQAQLNDLSITLGELLASQKKKAESQSKTETMASTAKVKAKQISGWKELKKLNSEIPAYFDRAEDHLGKAVAEIEAGIKKIHRAIQICPQTDGTQHHDSLLSNERIIGQVKLEMRRKGLKLAAPWFQDENKIPSLA